MTLKLQIVSVAFSLGLILLIFELARRKFLKESYSLIWFFVAGGFLVLSIFGGRLSGLAGLLGFVQVSNAIFVYAIFLLLILILGLTAAITRLSKTSEYLAQEIGLLKNLIEEKTDKKRDRADEQQ
ncbi:MAG: hypothetical protein IEMM0002_0315 [bacterium]|nr:MAG: hypothetical protein IEMM0002_0315 [bacterium]